eukprot:13323-Heterococcus_DN1.PRE.2
MQQCESSDAVCLRSHGGASKIGGGPAVAEFQRFSVVSPKLALAPLCSDARVQWIRQRVVLGLDLQDDAFSYMLSPPK